MLGLIDTGIRSIRSVTNDLRPSLLDDLGLLPALRSLVAEFGERSGMRVGLAAPAALPPLSERGGAGALPRAPGGAVQRAAPRRGALGGRRHLGAGATACCWRCGTTAGDSPPASTAGAAGARRATWDSPGCGSGSARSAARSASSGEPGAGALLEVLVPAGGGRRPVSEAPIRVLVADDHAIVRTGIRHVLESEPGFSVVAEASTGAEALELAASLQPDVVVLDISMPGESGLAGRRAAAGALARDPGPHPQHARQHRVRAGERCGPARTAIC